MGDQIKALEKGVDVLIATPGPADGPVRPRQDPAHRLQPARHRRGRPDARHGLHPRHRGDLHQAARRTRQTLLFSATMPPPIKKLADKFLTNPKSIEVARPATAEPADRPAHDPGRLAQEARRAGRLLRSERRPQRDRLLQPQDDGARARHQPEARPASTSARSRATWSSPTGSASSTASRTTRSTSSSPPTSPRAGSTSRASATSSTMTCPGIRTIMSTASAAPAAPARPASRSPWSTSEDAESIDNIQKLTGTTIAEMDGDEAGPRRQREPRAPAASESRAREDARREPRAARKRRRKREPRAEREPAARPREPAPRRRAAPRAQAAPRARARELEPAEDDGWNGPVPSFLGKGFELSQVRDAASSAPAFAAGHSAP